MPTSKTAQAYAAIERLIVLGDIEPGSLVSEATLMDRTGFGRTPVREALQRLARNRMVEVHPSRGVLVPTATVEAQLRMLELRRELECLAVRLATGRAPADVRASMTDMVRRLDGGSFSLVEYTETVRETHGLIVAGAANEFLADAIAPAQGLSRRFWFLHVRDETHEIARGSMLHSRILTEILQQDTAAAVAASRALNDYLVEFALATLPGRRP